MRLRNVKGSSEIIAANEFVVHEPKEMKGKWKEFFQNDNPIHIEIGMGKGQFLLKMAELNPDINYIGIEMYDSVLVRAIEKREKAEIEISNLFYIRMNAETITEVFERDEVDRIYLNFSDPWPKDRHSKRRLTSRQFLDRYAQFLKPEGVIMFKTDNRGLFDFSLEEVKETKWEFVNYTFDLHHSEYNEGNVMTEYEQKFSSMGQPIYRMVIKH